MQRHHLAVVRNTRRLRSALVALALGRRLLLDLDLSSLLEEEELVQSLLQSDLGRAGAAHLGFYSLRVRRRHLALEEGYYAPGVGGRRILPRGFEARGWDGVKMAESIVHRQ